MTTEARTEEVTRFVASESRLTGTATGLFDLPFEGGPTPSPCQGRELPLVAIWLRQGNLSNGEMLDRSRTPIRAAVWDDGVVLFGEDPRVWDYGIRRGRLSLEDVAAIKEEILVADLFDLPATCYLVDDGAIVCTLVNMDGRSAILYWNEYESSLRAAQPQNAAAFQKAWTKLNSIVCAALNGTMESVDGIETMKVPQSWYIKPMIQSE
jgi:hypothetical protein